MRTAIGDVRKDREVIGFVKTSAAENQNLVKFYIYKLPKIYTHNSSTFNETLSCESEF